MNYRRPLSLVAAIAVLAGCSRREAGPETSEARPAARVSVETIRLESVPSVSELTGVVRPARRATLSTKVMGTIDRMPVSLGQRARAGDVLANIASEETAARLAQAQAQLSQAKFDLGRESELLAKNASTSDLVHSLETRVSLSEASVREAEAVMGYAVIRAPFDCVVSRKFADVGDLAAPGSPLIEVEGADAFVVEADLPDSLVGALKPGSGAEIAVAAAAAPFTATLSELSSAADTASHTVRAKFTVPAGANARSGQFARVRIPGIVERMLLAPASAVVRDGQMERVFVVGEGRRAQLRLVRTGATVGGRVEILSGLDDGESVVVAPPAGMREGESLEVQP
jgi:membrane fusion protein (multidrug efflux system)